VNFFFRDEIEYLRRAGGVFAHANPKLASHLGVSGDDPDVERVLEGLAYLTGRVNENMAHESVEFNHSLIAVLWPNFLRPHPSATLMSLTPKPGRVSGRQIVPAGTIIESRLIEGVRLPFRTRSDCILYPLELVMSEVSSTDRLALRLHFSSLKDRPLGAIDLCDLRLTFCGEMPVRQMLYLWCGRYLRQAVITLEDGQRTVLELKKQMVPIGLAPHESLLPHPRTAFEGTRLLQEFFTFPDKFYGYDLLGLDEIFSGSGAQKFDLTLTFERALPHNLRIMPDSVALYCVSAVNLFAHDADPLLIRHEKKSYPLRPSGERAELVEIFSVDAVRGIKPSRDGKRHGRHFVYPAFESFLHERDHDPALDGTLMGKGRMPQIYYRLRPFLSRKTSGFDYEISFVEHHHDDEWRRGIPDEAAISIELSCFHRSLCHELAIGDISTPQVGAPDFVTYRNIVRPSVCVHPPLDGALSWILLANLALNYTTLLSREALAALLTIYDYGRFASPQHQRLSAQRIAGIESFETQPVNRFYKGLAVRGMKSVMRLRERAFHTEGEMYLFSCLLAEFFNLCSTVNSFHELEVLGAENGEIYQWPAKIIP